MVRRAYLRVGGNRNEWKAGMVAVPVPARGFEPWNEARARALVAPFEKLPKPVVERHHAVLDAFGHVPEPAVAVVADVMNLSRAEVHGVVSFYDWFRTEPPGKRVLRVCRAEACQSMGAEALLAHAKEKLGIALHETRADGAVSLEPVFCLGLCGCAPAVMVDDRVYGRVSPSRFDALAEREGIA